MIKFWKSAAKGRSGCPVRPPEASSTIKERIKLLVNNQVEEENQDYLNLFDKKSKLSLSLNDILVDKNALQYFVQFMESIDKQNLVKSWLDIEKFKACVREKNILNENETHAKINRANSFDVCYNHHNHEKEMQIRKWNDNSTILHNANNLRNGIESSTSSCGNLAQQTTHDYDSCNKPTEEAINLFKKYVALEAPYQLDLPDGNRKAVISNICQPEGLIKEDCFKPVQDIIFSQIENNHYNDFLNSPFYIKAQIDILTNSSLNVKDILYNETILFYFTEYLEQESCRVLLEFLMAVMNFRDNLTNSSHNQTADQVQGDAIVLYEKYFSLQATNPVGFPTDIRLRIESEICREEGPLSTCFDLPYQIVFRTLNQYVKTFLESELYYKYLSEMIHSVDQMWSSNLKSHSDCSSEFSISTQNTLLAMGDPVFRRKKRHLSVPDMTIDSNQLYNADSLWQRTRYEGLSLGRVNSLGRFESKFEPDPDKKCKSVLKKMVSKFVPANTSKVEEEMAWQIAHMIVKDVTDLTMTPPDNEHDDI